MYRKERGSMATEQTQIRIDVDVKREAADLFKTLGMDLSSAVNIFFKQCILRGGLPFAVEIPQYSHETLLAMEEARRISRDNSVPSYDSMEEFKRALES